MLSHNPTCLPIVPSPHRHINTHTRKRNNALFATIAHATPLPLWHPTGPRKPVFVQHTTKLNGALINPHPSPTSPSPFPPCRHTNTYLTKLNDALHTSCKGLGLFARPLHKLVKFVGTPGRCGRKACPTIRNKDCETAVSASLCLVAA